MNKVIRNKKGQIVKGNNFEPTSEEMKVDWSKLAALQPVKTEVKEEIKEKVCKRCKKVIGAKDAKCPYCFAPTTWER